MTDRTELRHLLDEATPRPWEAEGSQVWGPDGVLVAAVREHSTIVDRPDAHLIVSAVNALPSLLDQLDAAEAALARVRELHEHWPIHGDGDHPEDCDCGDPWVTVCRLCCTDGEDQHETCALYHDHGPNQPICPTIAAMGGEQS